MNDIIMRQIYSDSFFYQLHRIELSIMGDCTDIWLVIAVYPDGTRACYSFLDKEKAYRFFYGVSHREDAK